MKIKKTTTLENKNFFLKYHYSNTYYIYRSRYFLIGVNNLKMYNVFNIPIEIFFNFGYDFSF